MKQIVLLKISLLEQPLKEKKIQILLILKIETLLKKKKMKMHLNKSIQNLIIFIDNLCNRLKKIIFSQRLQGYLISSSSNNNNNHKFNAPILVQVIALDQILDHLSVMGKILHSLQKKYYLYQIKIIIYLISCNFQRNKKKVFQLIPKIHYFSSKQQL